MLYMVCVILHTVQTIDTIVYTMLHTYLTHNTHEKLTTLCKKYYMCTQVLIVGIPNAIFDESPGLTRGLSSQSRSQSEFNTRSRNTLRLTFLKSSRSTCTIDSIIPVVHTLRRSTINTTATPTV